MSDFRSGPDWAEYDPASAPQVVVADAPEVVVPIPMNNLSAGGDGNASIDKNNDGTGNGTGNGSGPPALLAFLQRLRPHWKVLVAAAGLLLSAVVLAIAIPLSLKKNNNQASGPSNTASTSSNPSVHSTARAPSSITTGTTTPSASKAPECDSSKFVRDVSWIGIDNGRDWKYRLKPAKSPEDCCTICYQSTPEGCNGWLYVKTNTNTPNCNLVYGYSGPNKSNTCPAGKPDLVYNDGEGQGGGGPCAGQVRV